MDHVPYIAKALRPHRRRLVVATIAALGIILVDLGSPLVMAMLIDIVIIRDRYDLLPPLMIFFLCLPFVAAFSRTVSNYLMTVLSQRLVLDIRLDLYQKVQRLSCGVLQNTTTGKLMERLRGDVQQLQMLLTNQTPMLLIQLVTGLVMVGVMFFFSVRLTLLVLAAMGLYVANYKWFVRRIRVVQRRYRRKMDGLSTMAQERLTGNIEVKAFGNERRESREFIRRNFMAERVHHRYRILNLSYGITSSAIAWSTYLTVMVLGTLLAVTGSMTYGGAIAMTALTMRLLDPAIQLAELSNQIQQAKVSLDRIFELMRSEPDAIEEKGLRSTSLQGEVAFENVCFEYERGKPVLRQFNLYVRAGQTIALVGPTGCGKTTIASLLYRYHEPQAGHIEIDGHDVSVLDTRWYRRQLAMVPQEPIIFDTTIGDNIAYGCPSADRENIERAARTVELGHLLDGFPSGLDTRLGEYGATLSVGEKQRLSIARAILADPAILILDEATSSLDPHSETLIRLALRRVMANRTCFVIAHRLSTIVEADQIVVLNQGRVLEIGRHGQLMSKPKGIYRQMFLTQMGSSRKVGVA